MRWSWLMGSQLFQNTERCFEMKCQSIETSFVSWILWNHRENHHYVKSSWIVTDWHHLRNCFAKETHGSTGSTGCFFLTRREEVQLLMDQAVCCVIGGRNYRKKERWVNVDGHGDDVDDDVHHHHHHDQLRRRKFQPLPLGSTSYPQKIDCRISPALWTMIQQAEEK